MWTFFLWTIIRRNTSKHLLLSFHFKCKICFSLSISFIAYISLKWLFQLIFSLFLSKHPRFGLHPDAVSHWSQLTTMCSIIWSVTLIAIPFIYTRPKPVEHGYVFSMAVGTIWERLKVVPFLLGDEDLILKGGGGGGGF